MSILASAGKFGARKDDDFIDRLSHRYTSAVLVAFAVVVTTTQYVGDPIHCWVPAHFTGNHETYTNNICWISNTYYLPFKDDIPKADEIRRHIPYYQWVPLILLAQALLFFLPRIVWISLSTKSGIELSNIVSAASDFQNTEHTEKREQTLRHITRRLDRFLGIRAPAEKDWLVWLRYVFSRTCCFICGRRYGSFLVILYMVVKLLYIANLFGQLFVLNEFLGTDFNMYGIDVLVKHSRGEDWTNSPRFPRVTMCDFTVRRLGNLHKYTVQCVLPINLFNEKIYLFIWFWIVIVTALACGNFIAWFLKSLFQIDRMKYVKKHLKLMDRLERESDKALARKFVIEYLRQDGILVLRLIGHNTNGIVVTELVTSLWDYYRSSQPMILNANTEHEKDSNVWLWACG